MLEMDSDFHDSATCPITHEHHGSTALTQHITQTVCASINYSITSFTN
jgi:hypothetical protein